MKAIGMKSVRKVHLNSLLEQLWLLDTLILWYCLKHNICTAMIRGSFLLEIDLKLWV